MRKLSHINTLADEVSEEFQKPLTIVKGFTQLLGAEQNKTNKEYVPIILTELNRAEKIIDSYIKLAKTESFPSRTISSKELLEVVIQTIQTYARNNQVHLHINKVRNLRIKGNMELLTESFNSIIKFCIDANDGSNKVIQINHYLKKNDVIFEVVLKEGNIKEEQIETLRHLPVLPNQQENAPLQAACTILFAHGGDIQLRDHLFKRKSLILTLPAQIKKRSTLRSKVVSTN
jgi:light-regulated signal transduction histidine kinase (bacteriophytochrome)